VFVPGIPVGPFREGVSRVKSGALGLEWVTEYINPRDNRQHRMYTCSLDGCKSAWWTSDDMYNYVIKPKIHLKNFFKKQYPEVERISEQTAKNLFIFQSKSHVF